MRSVFLGTPDIAVPALLALADLSDLRGVVCQPDRPAGRGHRLTSPAVKVAAEARGWPVYQPSRVRDGSLATWMREREAEIAVVMAYGRILPREVLDAPPLGCVNLHASLLPRHRGATPIQGAILAGDAETGVTLMRMDEGLDTGPMLAARRLALGPETTGGSLAEELAALAAQLLREELPRYGRGELEAVPQDEALATHTRPMHPEDAQLDFRGSAEALERAVRAHQPRPGARGRCEGTWWKLCQVAVAPAVEGAAVGEVRVTPDRRVLIQCGEGALQVLRAQREGKRDCSAVELLNGRAFRSGERFDLP